VDGVAAILYRQNGNEINPALRRKVAATYLSAPP
jgi:hypothetical protein